MLDSAMGNAEGNNVARRLRGVAQRNPDGVAIVEQRASRRGVVSYRQVTFRQLDDDSSRIAGQLRDHGVRSGERLVLLVPPGIDFVSLVYAILKSSAVMVLIDPGIGRQHLVDCLTLVKPDGFVAIPRGQLARRLFHRRFPAAKLNVTVGPSWFWGDTTLHQLRQHDAKQTLIPAGPDDPAAIIFTSGSTGPPKGVLYRHGNFDRQVTEIGDRYDIRAGEIDVACFPLFALFNAAMGVTTVFPDMDFTRPAAANPKHILSALHDWSATQAFGSPALWNSVGFYWQNNPQPMPSLKRVLSAGAPVPPHVLRCMSSLLDDGCEMHTPYGATEALPIASISATEVLRETVSRSEDGAGTCVGTRFPGIEWKVVGITDDPIPELADAKLIDPGNIGELIVRGAVVTTEYVTKTEANAYSKIRDGDSFWHRMGDVGYLDDADRFWYCGRKAHRVVLPEKTMYTIPCEAIVNRHPAVYRSALVSVGPPTARRPVLVVELSPGKVPSTKDAKNSLRNELLTMTKSHQLTSNIDEILLHPQLPVDIRHNSKIFREKLALWAGKRLLGG